jgi:hypothetical protein
MSSGLPGPAGREGTAARKGDQLVWTWAQPRAQAAGHEERAPSDGDAIVTVVAQSPAGICLSCGGDLSEPLRRSASLRCHDCRDSGAPLRRELVEPGTQVATRARRRRLFRRVA